MSVVSAGWSQLFPLSAIRIGGTSNATASVVYIVQPVYTCNGQIRWKRYYHLVPLPPSVVPDSSTATPDHRQRSTRQNLCLKRALHSETIMHHASWYITEHVWGTGYNEMREGQPKDRKEKNKKKEKKNEDTIIRAPHDTPSLVPTTAPQSQLEMRS